MSEPRLATGVWVSALVRRANAAGDFATVVRRGDAAAGAVILLARARDGSLSAYSRLSGLEKPRWEEAASAPPQDLSPVDKYLAAQLRYDEDLWLVELVTEDIERLIDETVIRR